MMLIFKDGQPFFFLMQSERVYLQRKLFCSSGGSVSDFRAFAGGVYVWVFWGGSLPGT